MLKAEGPKVPVPKAWEVSGIRSKASRTCMRTLPASPSEVSTLLAPPHPLQARRWFKWSKPQAL